VEEQGKPKDTLLNIQDTKEFTISIADSKMVGQVSLSSCEYSRDVDEFVKAGLTKQILHSLRYHLLKSHHFQWSVNYMILFIWVTNLLVGI